MACPRSRGRRTGDEGRDPADGGRGVLRRDSRRGAVGGTPGSGLGVAVGAPRGPRPLLAVSSPRPRRARCPDRADPAGDQCPRAPFYHPRRVAEEGAMLHLLSKGRFVLGVGMGYRAEEYEAFGLRPASKGTRYERGLRELTSLLSPEHAAGDGDALPVEPWARPPVWAGGWGPENLRRAATYADAWIPGPTADMGKLLECREIYHRHLREAGRDPREREAPLTRELIVAPTERE